MSKNGNRMVTTIHFSDPCFCRLKAHATTFEAAVHGFGSVQELKSIRKEVQAKFPPAQARVGIPLRCCGSVISVLTHCIVECVGGMFA